MLLLTFSSFLLYISLLASAAGFPDGETSVRKSARLFSVYMYNWRFHVLQIEKKLYYYKQLFYNIALFFFLWKCGEKRYMVKKGPW